MSLKHRWSDLLALFAVGRHDNPEEALKLVTAAMADDELLSGLMVALANRLDDLMTPAGAEAVRHALETDAQAAELAVQISHQLNEHAKPLHLRASLEAAL